MDNKSLLKATDIYGSPIYLYDLEKIKSQLIKFKESFRSIGDIKVQYAATVSYTHLTLPTKA